MCEQNRYNDRVGVGIGVQVCERQSEQRVAMEGEEVACGNVCVALTDQASKFIAVRQVAAAALAAGQTDRPRASVITTPLNHYCRYKSPRSGRNRTQPGSSRKNYSV